MLFNSYSFIFVFLPIVFSAFFFFAKFRITKAATASLVLASLFFYAYWEVAYLPLLLFSILFNFQIGRQIEQNLQGNKRRLIFIFGVTTNLLLLGYFKYANFFVDSFNTVFHTGWSVQHIALPLGISFFTFTQIAYLVDAYRGETKGYKLLTYSLFVTFFPHLIAGPILYHKDIIPQFHRLRNFVFSHKNTAMGLTLFTLGLFKKVVIADTLSPWAGGVFNNPGDVGFVEAWIGVLSYTFQIYFDFSGYSDMAIGLGYMLNITLPINFNSPYKATSIIDFWRRWHMTLSFFLRHYLYIPLGGNRYGAARQMINLLITMLLGGLWHGAGWTFVIWGGLHGTYLVVNHLWRRLNIHLPGVIAWGITFLSVTIGWVFFRANNVYDGLKILKIMAGLENKALSNPYGDRINTLIEGKMSITTGIFYMFNTERGKSLIAVVVLLLCVTLLPNTQQIMQRFKPSRWLGIMAGILALYTISYMDAISEFLYFQF